MIRKPIVAGQFYSEGREDLLEEIRKCFLSEFGIGKLPVVRKSKKRKVVGSIVPHAGYVFSGACASHAYYEISKEKVNLFIIFGTNHHGIGSKVATSAIDWETPLGLCKVDREFVNELLENDVAKLDETAHAYEHSIEVQLPFIQFIQRDFKFCPILLRDLSLEECEDIAEKLWKVLEKREDFVIIASSDFTHYGAMYAYLPFVENVKENLYKIDGEAIDLILNLEFREFFKLVEGEGRTICGFIPITLLLILMKKIKANGKLLKYYTSGDILKDYSNAVGYASIVFEL